MFKWMLLCILALSTVACGGTSEQVVEARGVVQSRPDLEGGWWYIQADSGEKYTPLPLPDEFKVPGLTVQVSMVLLKDTASVYPGIYVRIIGIEKLAVAPTADRQGVGLSSPTRRPSPCMNSRTCFPHVST